METAEKQVTDVVKIDIHLDYTPDGKRYIHRISEIVQLEEGIPYPDYDPNKPTDSMAEITKEYYQRSTDRVGFSSHTILEYDLDTHTYVTTNRFSEFLEERLRGNLEENIRKDFDAFMLKEWGPRENSAEAGMKDEELDKLIANMEKEIEKNNQAAVEANEAAEGRNIMADDLEPDFENELRGAWKAGYGNEDEKIGEFEIGAFFDDDDYDN